MGGVMWSGIHKGTATRDLRTSNLFEVMFNFLYIAQMTVQVQCTRIRTSDFECTEDGNQSYIGCRCPKFVLVRRRRVLQVTVICAI